MCRIWQATYFILKHLQTILQSNNSLQLSSIRWYGCVARMNNKRIPNKIVTARIDGIRKREDHKKDGLMRLKRT